MRLDRRAFLSLSVPLSLAACGRRIATRPAPAAAPPPTTPTTPPTSPPTAPPPAVHTLVVRGGLVLDGQGNPPRAADIGIRDGRIVALGDLSRHRGEVELDATGRHVCPGFIDLHSHADETCITHPNVESVVRQGVTTVLVGQDGFSLAEWPTFAEYQRALESHPASVNVASMIGQGTIRRRVIGDRVGRATAAEVEKMRAIAEEALRAGAFGISSGLEYPPSANAEQAELTALCHALAPTRALYMTHMRNEDDRLIESIQEAIAVARDSGARLHVSHLKASGRRNWSKLDEALGLLERARDIAATADCYPYEAYSTGLGNLFPPASRGAGTKAFVDTLRDPKASAPLRAAAEAKVAMLGSWDAVMLTGTGKPGWDGRRLGELAQSLRRAPIDLTVDLLVERGGAVGMIGFGMSEDNVAHTIAHALVAVASDGAALATAGPLSQRRAHPRAYGTFPRVLGRFVREKKALDLAQAVRKMTSMPADILGLRDRGRIAEGAAADIVVFDAAHVEDRATYENPHQYPSGITHVLVNGELVVDGPHHTGRHPGRVLRRG